MVDYNLFSLFYAIVTVVVSASVYRQIGDLTLRLVTLKAKLLFRHQDSTFSRTKFF